MGARSVMPQLFSDQDVGLGPPSKNESQLFSDADVGLQNPDEIVERGMLLPIGRERDGDTVLALPEFLAAPRDTIMGLLEGTKTAQDVTGKEVLELGGVAAGPTVRGVGNAAVSAFGAKGLTPVSKAPVSHAVQATVNAAGNKLASGARTASTPFRTGQGVVDDILQTTLTREGVTPADVRRGLDQGQAATRFGSNSKSQLPENLADLTGEAGQGLLEATVLAPGRARTTVRNRLNERQAGTAEPFKTGKPVDPVKPSQANRLMDNLERAFQLKSGGTALKTEKQIQTSLVRESAPKYRAAFNKADDFDISPAILNAMNEMTHLEGKMLGGMKKAVKMFMDGGTRSKQKVPFSQSGQLRRLDGAKRELDDMIARAKRSQSGNLVRLLTKFKNEVLDGVHGGDRLNPTINKSYSEARDLWAGGKRAQDVIQMGRDAFKEGAELTAETIAGLSTGELKLFRRGLIEAVKRKLPQERTHDATKFLRRVDVQEIIAGAMPKRAAKAKIKQSDNFGELLNREQNMVVTRGRLANSRTAFRLESQEDFNRLTGFMTKLRSGGLTSAVVDTASLELQRAFGMREQVAARLADILTDTDPKNIAATLQRLEQRIGKDDAQDVMGVVMRVAEQVEQAAQLNSVPGAVRTLNPAVAEDDQRQ